MDRINRRSTRKLLLTVAVAAVLAGVTMAAITVARPAAHPRPGGTLATAAGYLGMSTAELQRELQSGESLAQIANATGGRSTSGLIDALVAAGKARLAAAAAKLPERVAAEVNRVGGPNRPTAVVGYLGVSPAQLRSELRSGKTLAQIADATSGKSAAGLVEAIVAARKARLAALVSTGNLTRAQEAARLRTLNKRVSAAVNRTRRLPPRHQPVPRG